MSLDGLSLSALVAELHQKLAGGRIDKIFQFDKYSLALGIRQPGENIRVILSCNPERPGVYLTDTVPENPDTPPAFCMVLRKHLEDGRIGAITQHELDRIIIFHMDVRGERGLIETKQLIVELMGKHSNIILVQGQNILDAARRVGYQMSRVRQVLPGRPYASPPGQSRLNVLQLPPSAFVNNLLQQPAASTVAKAVINTGLGLGPLTAREMLWRAGLPFDCTCGTLDNADLASLSEALNSITEPLQHKQYLPTVTVDSTNRIVGIAAFTPEHLAAHTSHTFNSMSKAVFFSLGLTTRRYVPEKDTLQKLLYAEIAKLNRKEATLRQELQEALQAETWRHYADILMANLTGISPGVKQATLADLYSADPEHCLIEIPLDDRLTALENANAYYHRYNKFKRAQQSLTDQLAQCKEETSYLEGVAVSLELSEKNQELYDIKQELIATGYLPQPQKRRAAVPPSVPLSVVTKDNATVLVGKNNRQNDHLTLKQAQPDDLWFHTKDIPGSHVILRSSGAAASEDDIAAAALLAAYFSKARHSATVPVDYTKRRYVKKPSGAKPGFVIYERQKTLYVTPAAEKVQELLRS